MPPRMPKACRVRGCRSTTTDPSGYCESHKGEGWKSYKLGQSRYHRGYGTKWEAIRARILKRDKTLCQNHLRQGIESRLPVWTTLRRRLTAALMMTLTLKACAGRVTPLRPRVSGSSENQCHHHSGEGDVKSLRPCAFRTARLLEFFYPRKIKFNQECLLWLTARRD